MKVVVLCVPAMCMWWVAVGMVVCWCSDVGWWVVVISVVLGMCVGSAGVVACNVVRWRAENGCFKPPYRSAWSIFPGFATQCNVSI